MRTRRTHLNRCRRTGLATAASLPGGASRSSPVLPDVSAPFNGFEDGRLATEST